MGVMEEDRDMRHMVKCPICKGTGDSSPKVICDRCDGTGSVDEESIGYDGESDVEEESTEDPDDGDDLICPICNGLGEDPRTDKICTSCHGQGWKSEKGGEYDN
jgi:DnaJ-class molecular chaperone